MPIFGTNQILKTTPCVIAARTLYSYHRSTLPQFEFADWCAPPQNAIWVTNITVWRSKHILPTHCKNDIRPEPRSEDVFKELDHAFQSMSKSWRLRTSSVWLRRLNISPPAHWRGWQRRWPAWSPPSGTSPTAPQSHDRSQHHLQSLVISWSRTADRLNRLSWSWFWFI